jgi:mRNA-degrading endonuclease RelE of RelBE toxin-antitoxin system
LTRHPISPQAERALQALPAEHRARLEEALRRFQANPRHPSLQFERIAGHPGLYSIRITPSHRAILRRVTDSADETYGLVDIGLYASYRRL